MRRRLARVALCTGALLLCGSSTALAQYEGRYEGRDYGRDAVRSDGQLSPVSIRTGLGFTADPDTFLLGFEVDIRATRDFSTGLRVDIGVEDERTIVSPVIYGRVHAHFFDDDPDLKPLVPYFQAGFGFTHWEIERQFLSDVDDTEFLVNLGFGAEYALTRRVSVGSQMLFNIVPGEVFDERFYFSWEIASFRYRF